MEHLDGGGGMADGVNIVAMDFEEDEIIDIKISDMEDIEIVIGEEEIVIIDMEQ